MNQAIDRNGTYCSPSDAVRGEQYTCPDCEGEVVPRKGNIRIHHFAHKASHSCDYFERTGEGQLHRYAKLRLKHRLETEKVHIERYCVTCKIPILNVILPRLINIRVEHTFEHNGITGIADVHADEEHESFYAAVIFEVYSKHKTRESDRPDDEVYSWYEIDANDVANTPLKCVRQLHCESCEHAKRIQQEEFEAAEYHATCKKTKERQEWVDWHKERERIDELYDNYVDTYVHPVGACEPDEFIEFQGCRMLHPYYAQNSKKVLRGARNVKLLPLS